MLWVMVVFPPALDFRVAVLPHHFKLAMAEHCIKSNPDIAGIGVRTNFYATIFLIALIPENEHTAELMNRLYENSVFYGLALVMTAVIQTLQEELDLYHAIFVMQIIFSLNFVYEYGMRKFMRVSSSGSTESRRGKFRMGFIIAIQMFTTVVFTIWLLYVWIKDSHFGSQPECNHLVKYVFFFVDVRATATWLRVLFILYLVFFTCTLLFRFGLIVFACMDGRRKPRDVIPRAVQGNAREKTVYTYLVVVLLVGSAIFGVTILELIVQRNRINIQTEPGEGVWGFGQIISLILILGCVIDIVVTIREWYRQSQNTADMSPE
ncbi:hypothetical protein BJV78DRAFT_92394 [Lactifluus subvellereus]|nr:hypothetical protein BJV78DRAFT_92394 [Lactifluus subvellereus]